MPSESRRKRSAALLVAVVGAHAAATHAADDSVALGVVYGYGNLVNIYGVQGVWAPQQPNEVLAPHDLSMRVTGQVARWVTTNDASPNHSLIDSSVVGELRYTPRPGVSGSPFIEASFGFHLLSHVYIEWRNMATAFNFGSGAAIGFTFGPQNRFEIAGLIQHVSNGGIKEPNYGLTYNGIRLRMALE